MRMEKSIRKRRFRIDFSCANCISEFVCEHSRDLCRPPRAIYLNLNLNLNIDFSIRKP